MTNDRIVAELLASQTLSALVMQKGKKTDIVVGVPHHAPRGVTSLPCLEHAISDENAGFLGRLLAADLGCCSAIACNYSVDPNKGPGTDYSRQLVAWAPRILIEIHGHSGKRAGKDVVEVSCGSAARNRYSVEIAGCLTRLLHDDEHLPGIRVMGDFAKLEFQATRSWAITNDAWIAYHFELPPVLRLQRGSMATQPPQSGVSFCRHVASVIDKLHPAKELSY